MVSDVFIGTNYHDVVRPNKLQVVEKEGQSQTVLSWKKKSKLCGSRLQVELYFYNLMILGVCM